MTIGKTMGHSVPSRQWGASPLLALNDLFIGVEVELEGLNGMPVASVKAIRDSGLWEITDDASLRNGGREFILKEVASQQPVMGLDIIRGLQVFQKSMDSLKKAPTVSERTSIHVHLDVRGLEEDELIRLMLLYYTFEDIFFKWIGEDRDQSNYCRTASKNYDIITRVADLISKDGDSLPHRVARGNKYDALNFASIRGLGTVEFRGMRATTDTEVMLTWINLLMRLHETCRDHRISIADFPEMVSSGGLEAFLEQVFKAEAKELLPHATMLDILRGVRTAQEILVVAEKKEQVGLSQAYSDGRDHSARLNKFKTKVLGG